MATTPIRAQTEEAAAPDKANAVRYVARQPILDLRGRVHGYELLFRHGTEEAFHGNCDVATRTMLDNTVIFGLERLTGGLPGFVNCTGESLTESLVNVLPPSMTVLELLETVDLTPDVIAACRKLKSAGFRLALDDFTWRPHIEPLVAIADYIKVDFLALNAAERHILLKRLHGNTVCLLAEKIETQEDYKIACQEGFTLFQGFYFCRPVLLKNRKVPANRIFYFQILEMLRHNPLDMRRLGELVKRDASLTWRLLRLVNSPVCPTYQEISSIESALVIVGEDTFRRIATLAIASEIGADQPAEILRMAFVRGRFCEAAAPLCRLNPSEQYLLGILSMLPAMLRMPMEALAPALPLREEIREALLGTANTERSLLDWLEAYERCEWTVCDAILQGFRLKPEQIVQLFAESVGWADTALHSGFRSL
jgi:EAL and modified HD-GYP domain-containing signal transduction protein